MSAQNAKGKLPHGSPAYARLVELLGLKETGVRETAAAEPARPMTWQEITRFYGVERRFYYSMEEIGRKGNLAPPWGDAVDLVAWFGKMKVAGLRKQNPPPSIVARFEEERIRRMRGGPSPVPVTSAFPASAFAVSAPSDPAEEKEGQGAPAFSLGGAATPRAIVENYQRLAATLMSRATAAAAWNNMEEYRAQMAELTAVTDKLRPWLRDLEKMEGAGASFSADEVKAAGIRIAREVLRQLRLAIEEGLGPDRRAEAVSAFTRAGMVLPDLLRAAFETEFPEAFTTAA